MHAFYNAMLVLLLLFGIGVLSAYFLYLPQRKFVSFLSPGIEKLLLG